MLLSEVVGRTPRIAFFTYPEWAFGAIHEALCKELYKIGIFATLLDWNASYAPLEMERLSQVYDIFVTHPGSGVNALLQYGIPYSQIVAIAHEVSDIESGLLCGNDYDSFRQYAVINPNLIETSSTLGISRTPLVVQNGVHFDWFYSVPSTSLQTLGYSGSLVSLMMDGVTDRKRGYLSSKLAHRSGLGYNRAEGYGYRTMPLFYRSVDAVVLTSLQDACGLPMMEAAAAGRLPLGTPVGILKQSEGRGGIILPFDPDLFLHEGEDVLRYYKRNPESYLRTCLRVQEYAKEYYDWPKVLPSWVKVFSS